MKIFFLVIWADAKFYNSLIFLSKHLSDLKNKVYVFCQSPNQNNDINSFSDFGENCKIIYFSKKKFIPLKIQLLFFLIKCLIFCIIKKPNDIIFFNQKSTYLIHLFKIFKKKFTRLIYHNFDYDLPSKYSSFKIRLFHQLEIFFSKQFDFFVFPSKERAELFSKITNINKSKFYVLQNCFSKKFKALKSSKFENFLIENELTNQRIICRMGTIGPNHFIEESIKAFNFLDKDYTLVIAGVEVDNYAEYLNNLIKSHELDKQIFIFKNVDNNLWHEILNNSHLGLCFYEQNFLSHKFMAGTSTKFNNYIYANLPMLVNNNNDFIQFKQKVDIFEIVNPQMPHDIAQKIKYLFNNSNRYEEIKKNLLKAFYSEFNFEKQFENSYKNIL